MKALVFTAPGRVEVLDVPEPSPKDGEIVVDVAASGICGSELHGTRAVGFRVPPLILGHEFAGTVGNRRVVVNPLHTCGSCAACTRGTTNLCPQRVLLGGQVAGGTAERVAVPAGSVRDIPDAMTWSMAALVEPVANAVHALRLAGARPGQRLGIVGAGAIGLSCLAVANAWGIDDVHVAEVSPERRELAHREGAATSSAELDGPFDVVVDAVGTEQTHAASLRTLRAGGTALWLGLVSPEAGFDALSLVREEKSVLGSFAYTGDDFQEALDLMTGLSPGWVTEVGLAESAEVFAALAAGRTDLAKVVVVP